MSAPPSRVALPVAQPVSRPGARGQPPVASPVAVANPTPSQQPKPVTPVSTIPTPTQSAPPPPAVQVAAPSPVAAASSSSNAHLVPVASPTPKSAPPSSPNEEVVDARMILDMPATRAYKLVDGTKRLVETGTLQLMSSSLNGDEVYLIVLGRVKLALRLAVPCLEMAPRSFVFPTDGVTYGIVIADAITDDVLEVFRLVLNDHTSFRVAAESQSILSLPDRPDRVVNAANSVAAGLGAGSVVVATNVIKGGRLVGQFITKSGEYLTTRLKPNQQPTAVSAETKAKLAKAKFLSGAACKVSKALVVGAMATTEALSNQLSSAIKETQVGKKLSSDPERPNERLDAAKYVGKSAIGAVLNVYQAIETAVFGVAHDAASATVTVVTHKYGDDAGAHTKEGLGVVGDVAVAAHSLKQIGVKSIAKKTAIKASQDVLTTSSERRAEEERRKQQAQQQQQQPASLMGQAMGLPPGVDPLQAVEAMQAAAVLASAAAPYIGPASAAASSNERVVVTTATATAATPAAAQAAATAAAQKAAATQQKY